MGNKLDATRIALDKGFTGVSDPTSTLSAISKGMKDVASWKKGIDDAEIKLKTDTAKAYQDSKKLASERMTGNKTVDAAILEALRSTQERLYDNVKMVEKGMQSPTDNLIFRQNASTSYDTLSSYLKDYDANFQQSLKEAQGYTDANGNYVKPTAGAFQSAIQKFQTTLGNPNLYKILSSEDGSLNINLYKTKINTKTNTRELDLDNDGNPIIDPTMSGIGASTILKGKNQKSPRVYMNDSINEALDKDTALSKAFEVIKTSPGYTGIVVNDARNNRNIERLINAGTGAATATVEQRMSILMDNMPPGKEQIPVMPNEVAGLKADGVDLKEQISYEYIDPSTGEMLQGKYNKYVTATLDPMSTLFMGEETDEAKIASIRIFKSGIYSGLQRKITGRDKTTTFRPTTPSGGEKSDVAYGELIKKSVLGDAKSFESLLRKSGLKTNLLDDGRIQFLDQDNRKVGEPLKISETKDKKKTFLNARDTAIQLASIFGVSPEVFDNKIKFDEGQKVLDKGLIQFGEAPEVRLDLTTNIGTTKDKLSIKESLLEASEAANSATNVYGIDGAVLADGIQSTLGQALQKTNQNLNSSPRVTYDKKNEIMTVTAVNSKGKTITISKIIDDDDGGNDAVAKKADAFVMDFLNNINSSEDYTSGGSEKKDITFQDWQNKPENKGKTLNDWQNRK
mgnify:CR=1 FL=1